VPALVLDASLAVAALLPDEATDLIAEILPTADADGIVVPALWCTEVGNAVLTAERRGRLTTEERREGLAWLARLRLEVDAPSMILAWGRVLDLSQRHRLTLYDATYLELAMRGGSRLATLDRALRRAAVAEQVTLLPA